VVDWIDVAQPNLLDAANIFVLPVTSHSLFILPVPAWSLFSSSRFCAIFPGSFSHKIFWHPLLKPSKRVQKDVPNHSRFIKLSYLEHSRDSNILRGWNLSTRSRPDSRIENSTPVLSHTASDPVSRCHPDSSKP